jgi:hypothetical protein
LRESAERVQYITEYIVSYQAKESSIRCFGFGEIDGFSEDLIDAVRLILRSIASDEV